MPNRRSMKRNKNRNKKIAAGCAVVLAAAVGFGGYGIWKNWNKQNDDSLPVSETSVGENTADGEITYNGETYRYNDHLTNMLFLGIDKREKAETKKGHADAGQADALFLLSWDRVTHQVSLLQIPRDTMTEIEVFDLEGKNLGKSKDHISLSYAFGDGDRESCELAKNAVSELLYGLPIQGYCSLNMDGLPILTRTVGNLTVTVPDDSLEKAETGWTKGAEIRLDEENTEKFVRYRDIETDQSALTRLNRQQIFLTAFAERAKEMYAEKPSFVAELYEALEPYMVTNIGNDQFAKIMGDVAAADNVVNQMLPGEGKSGSDFDEYHVDEDQLYDTIVEMFYVRSKP